MVKHVLVHTMNNSLLSIDPPVISNVSFFTLTAEELLDPTKRGAVSFVLVGVMKKHLLVFTSKSKTLFEPPHINIPPSIRPPDAKKDLAIEEISAHGLQVTDEFTKSTTSALCMKSV